jgi:E3 ubiquitin-protein ligase NRDP1
MASNIFENQRMHGFQYMDEDSIDDELKCSICTEPFVDPGTIWSCDHAFCRACIEKMLGNGIVCPICRNSDMLYGFRKATRNLVKILDRILVRCEYCNQINIERGNFTEHMNKLCPKVIVRCPADNNQCAWTGPRDQLDTHVTQCTAESRRFLLNEFKAVQKQIDQLQLNVRHIVLQRQQLVSCDKLNSEVMCLDQRCKILENSNQQLESQLSKLDQQSELLKQRLPSPKIVRKYPFATVVADCFTFISSSTGK